MSTKLKWIKNTFRDWSQIFSPHLCVFCEAPAPLNSNPAVCESCTNIHWDTHRCPRCQRHCHLSETFKKRCFHCQNIAYPFKSFRSLGPYKGVLRQAILRAKFHQDPLAYRFLNQQSSQLPIPDIHDAIWTYIPSHPKRLKERGTKHQHFPQMVQNLLKQHQKEFTPLLLKKETRRPQIELNEKERRKSLEDSFTYISKSTPIENLFLFDDVWSTGSTLQSACRVLKGHGVKNIYVFTMAFNDLRSK